MLPSVKCRTVFTCLVIQLLRLELSECSNKRLDVRLVGGPVRWAGTVEVRVRDNARSPWGAVCDKGWTIENAHVVCHQLGYKGASVAYGGSHFGGSSRQALLFPVKCLGNESRLDECSLPLQRYSRYYRYTYRCRNQDDAAGVLCANHNDSSQDPRKGTTRLVCGNTPRDGKVEILRPSGWSPVCNQFWNIRDASVVCRQLSFPGVESVQLTSRQFSNCRNPKTYKASQVKCLGTEHNWQSCSVRVGYCHESQQVAIRCSSDVRLVDGRSPHEGRVEIYFNGKWGTVCDDSWNEQDARVVCHNLGYVDASAKGATSGGVFRPGRGPILMDEVRCVGNEFGLKECPFSGWYQDDCVHREDAGVRCTGIRSVQTKDISSILSHEDSAHRHNTSGKRQANKKSSSSLNAVIIMTGFCAVFGIAFAVFFMAALNRLGYLWPDRGSRSDNSNDVHAPDPGSHALVLDEVPEPPSYTEALGMASLQEE